MRKILLLILFSALLAGCSTLNFSANYYTLPDNYGSEVKKLWDGLIANVPLKYGYTMSLVADRQCAGLRGIPQIENTHVRIPDNFIKYVYQNYYEDRFKILTCVIVHELCHSEYGLHSSSPAVHFQADQKAVELFAGIINCSAQDYYKSLFVLRNYWFARKGVGGHAFNLGWNALQAASLVYIGSAHFVDWFATDLDQRMRLVSRKYKVRRGSSFRRSQSQGKIADLERGDLSSLFLTAKSKN